MLKDLFAILFRPQQTLDNVLFDKNMRRSWQATWWLILFSSIATLLYMVMMPHQNALLKDVIADMDGMSRGIFWAFMIGGWFVVTALSIGVMALMRILFAWFVRMGLRISASDTYPTDPAERREKGRLLQLIHPYTLAIQQWPSLIMALVLSFFMGSFVGDIQNVSEDTGLGLVAGKLILFVIVYILTIVVGLGSYVYMIIVRVIAIKKIYNISGARAFWGPFLIYFLFTVIPYVTLFIALIVIGFMTAGTNQTY